MNPIAQTAVGLAAVGRPAYINLGRAEALPGDRDVAALRDHTHVILDDAYAAGIRHVDVARSYGRAEEFLASWLANRGHADVFVSSKWGYDYVGQWRLDARVHEVKEHSLSRFRRQWQQTRTLLGGVVALYQVHSLTVDSPLFTDRALQAALVELADEGVRVGFSASGPNQADTIRGALDIEVSGRRVFGAVQSTWNLLETSAGAALAEAHDDGVLVQVKETLANGRLAVRAPAPVLDVAARWGVRPDAVALAAVYARPWADVVLLGPSGPTQLADNLAGTRLTLDGDTLAELAGLAEPPADYWARRSALSWS